MMTLLNTWLNIWLPIIAPAWIAGSILALLSAPLGCLVLWRRMAFFADALAHGTLLVVAIPPKHWHDWGQCLSGTHIDLAR